MMIARIHAYDIMRRVDPGVRHCLYSREHHFLATSNEQQRPGRNVYRRGLFRIFRFVLFLFLIWFHEPCEYDLWIYTHIYIYIYIVFNLVS